MSIWNILFNAIFNLMIFVFSIFPDVDEGIYSAISSLMSPFWDLIFSLDFFLPVSTVLVFMTFIIIIETSLFTYRTLRYLTKLLSMGFFS